MISRSAILFFAAATLALSAGSASRAAEGSPLYAPGVTTVEFTDGTATAQVKSGDILAVFSTASETEVTYSYRIQAALEGAGGDAAPPPAAILPEAFPVLSVAEDGTGGTAPAGAIGNRETFWSWDMSDLSLYPDLPSVEVTAVLMASGKYADVYIDENSRLTTADAEKIARQFDTVAYPVSTRYFGTPPEVDGSDRVAILIALPFNGGIEDDFNPQGFSWGAVNAQDQQPPGPGNEHSNYRNLLYLNPAAITTTKPEYDNKWQSILSHEFQHLVNYRTHQERESAAVDEGKAVLAEMLSGYGLPRKDVLMWANIELYQQDPAQISLLQMTYAPEHGLATYGMGLLWATYLFDRFGADMVHAIATHPAPGVAGAAAVSGIDAPTLFTQWVQANILTGLRDDPAFGYRRIALTGDAGGAYYQPLLGFAARPEQALPQTETEREVPAYGVDYFRADGDGEVTLQGENISALVIRR